MPYIKNKLVVGIVILVIAVAHYLFSPLLISIEANDNIPEVNYVFGPIGTSVKPIVASLTGDLISFEKSAYGNVAIYDNNGQKILRFEDFQIVNGPGLSVYLATDITSEDFIDLGEVKATKGNVNYELPIEIDFEKYDTVLIWCETHNKLYSYAELK